VLEVNNSQQAYEEHDGTGTTLFEGQMHSIESFKISKPNIKRENGEYRGDQTSMFLAEQSSAIHIFSYTI
jgi:hypothetical protein